LGKEPLYRRGHRGGRGAGGGGGRGGGGRCDGRKKFSNKYVINFS